MSDGIESNISYRCNIGINNIGLDLRRVLDILWQDKFPGIWVAEINLICTSKLPVNVIVVIGFIVGIKGKILCRQVHEP